MLSLMTEQYTVYDVIITSANFLGGVHHGSPTRKSELRLEHLAEAADTPWSIVALADGSTGNLPGPIFTPLQEIGECLVDSLAPLVGLLSSRSI